LTSIYQPRRSIDTLVRFCASKLKSVFDTNVDEQIRQQPDGASRQNHDRSRAELKKERRQRSMPQYVSSSARKTRLNHRLMPAAFPASRSSRIRSEHQHAESTPIPS
jgi:hypothetical protein